MLLGVILSLFLIALGVTGAEALLASKAPAVKGFIARLNAYRKGMGFIGIVLGLASLIEWLDKSRYLGLFSFAGLLVLASGGLMLGLGLIFGFDFIRENLKDPNVPVVIKIDAFRASIMPFQQAMGLAAIAVGAICLLRQL
jgi:hypothetical protein